VRGESEERWRALCEQAVVEQDPDKLLHLIREINQLLEAKEQRLHKNRATRNISDELLTGH
jgi:hypothetical protein